MADLTGLVARAVEQDTEAEAELLSLAFCGSVEAQRAVIDIATCHSPASLDSSAWFRVEMFARVLAESGEMGDVLRLCAVLYLLSRAHVPEGRDRMQAEALTLLRECADAGEGQALAALAFYAPLFSPEARAAAELGAGEPMKDWDPPAIVRLPASSACRGCAPRADWGGGLKVWLVDRSWDLRFAWWKFSDWMRAR